MDLYNQIIKTATDIDMSRVKQVKRSDKMFNILFEDNTTMSYTVDDIFKLLLKNTVKMSQEDQTFLKELSHEMQTQDTRCTAQPYGLVISQEHKQTGIDPDYATNYAYYDNANSEVYYEENFQDLIDDLENWLVEKGGYQKLLDIIEEHGITSFYHLDRYCSHLIPGEFTFTGYDVNRTADHCNGMYEGNFFLTEKAANKFIERNKHNLSEPGTYGIHLYRNSEIDTLYKCIFNVGKVLNDKTNI